MNRLRFSALLLPLLCLSPGGTGAESLEPQPAIQARLAHEALALDIIRAGSRLLVVGERGHVLYSSDGESWTQASVPVQSTLTRATYAGDKLWAVGHDTTIIHSDDHGQTWTLQYFDPEAEQPLLDVHFFNEREGLAIGAYGLMLRTADGGAQWDSLNMADHVTSEDIDWEQVARDAAGDDAAWMDEVDDHAGAWDDEDELYDDGAGGDDGLDDDGVAEDPWDQEDYYDASEDFDRGCYEFMECHLNAIVALDGDALLIAAERGYGYRSDDRGETWESFRFGYAGSMFDLVRHGDCLLAGGLRGNVQRSCDRGRSWELLDSGVESSLMGAAVRADGTAVLVGANATIVEIPTDGDISVRAHRRGSDLAMVAEGPGGLIFVGEHGIQHD